jgi:DNA-binding CsgD family transcriptional regulator
MDRTIASAMARNAELHPGPFTTESVALTEGNSVDYRLLRAIVGCVREAVFVIDHQYWTILACNAQAEAMFACPANDMVDRETSVLHVDAVHCAPFGSRSHADAAVGRPSRVRCWMRRANGACFPSENTLTPAEDAGGRNVAIFMVRDLSPETHTADSVARAYAQLTQRERQVLAHTLRGQSAKQIARALSLSHRTVELHRARVLRKFNVRTVPQLLAEVTASEVVREATLLDPPT